jgi:hypothetical protein
MIDHVNRIIYIDNSTRSTFQSCKELARLHIRDGWSPLETANALAFGHAFHAAWASYYDALAGGEHRENGAWKKFDDAQRAVSPLQHAQAAFLRDLGHTGGKLPIQLESEERRSLERGLSLVDAYIYRWRNELYENILDEDGAPLTEVGFRYFLTEWEGYQVYYVGYIDRVMRSRANGRPVVFEGKTTTQGLSQFITHAKPNNQITGYFRAALELLEEPIYECVWDCVFVSSRRADMDKALLDRFWMYGIDVEKDFARQITSRTQADISDFLVDLEQDAIDYCKWLTSDAQRWPRSTGACHTYGGCMMRNRCSMNISPDAERQYMETYFRIARWEPWRAILERPTRKILL